MSERPELGADILRLLDEVDNEWIMSERPGVGADI